MRGESTDSVLARDILEWNVPEEVLVVLLKDRSTGRNLIWATDDYAARNCHTLCGKLSWSHYRLLAAVDNRDARDFYLSEAVECNASAPPLKRQWRFALCRRQRRENRSCFAGPRNEASDGMSPPSGGRLMVEFLV